MDEDLRRRRVLQVSALAVAGLAGCTGDDGNGGTPTATGTATPTTDTPTPTQSSGTPTPTTTQPETATDTGTPTVEADQRVVVGPGGDFRFDPESFSVGAGETVLWVWDSGGHNVRPSSAPDEASWTGTAGGDGTTYGAGHTYAHTFETTGQYAYYCAPHRSLGMTGSFRVG